MKLLFSFLFFSLFAKEPSDYRIPYRTLKFHDFRGKAPKDEPEIAGRATCTTDFDYIEDGGQYRFIVTAYFLPDSSFLRVQSRQVLIHEQTHFQIAYIASLKCMRDIAWLQGGDSLKMEQARSIYNGYLHQRNEINQQFDDQTNHGLKMKEEGDWEFRMNQELKKLQASAKKTNGRSVKNTEGGRPLHPS